MANHPPALDLVVGILSEIADVLASMTHPSARDIRSRHNPRQAMFVAGRVSGLDRLAHTNPPFVRWTGWRNCAFGVFSLNPCSSRSGNDVVPRNGLIAFLHPTSRLGIASPVSGAPSALRRRRLSLTVARGEISPTFLYTPRKSTDQ